MANLDPSAVTVLASYYEGGLQNKDYVTKRVTIALTGQGSATAGSQIPATALGLASIVKAENFVKSDNLVIYLATPSVDGSCLLLNLLSSSPGVPAALSGVTLTGTVTGPPNATY